MIGTNDAMADKSVHCLDLIGRPRISFNPHKKLNIPIFQIGKLRLRKVR